MHCLIVKWFAPMDMLRRVSAEGWKISSALGAVEAQ